MLWAREGMGNDCSVSVGGAAADTGGRLQRPLFGAGVGCPVKILTGRETEFFIMKVILTFRQLGLKITFSPIRKKAVTVTDQFTGC